jgi:trigger factor
MMGKLIERSFECMANDFSVKRPFSRPPILIEVSKSMTVTVHKEELEQRQMKISIEVPAEYVAKEMRKIAKKLARDIRFPGFRKGKAPYPVVLKRVGEGALRADAIEELVQPIFEEAVAQEGLDVYGQPTFSDMEQEPLQFIYIISLPPVIELGDYRSLRREVAGPEITEEAIDAALDEMREDKVVLTEVDRPVEDGDLVLLDGHGELVVEIDEEEEGAEVEESEAVEDDEAEEDDWNEAVIFDEEKTELVMDSSKLFAGTPFVENIVGLSAGDSCEFTFTFPDDYAEESLAGKEAEFSIDVINVQSRDLPIMDDDFAHIIDPAIETVAELREKTREQLHAQAEQAIRDELLEAMGKDLLADATIDYPQNAVEMELDDMVQGMKAQVEQSGWEMKDYLRLQGQTEDDLRNDFRDNAVTRFTTNLAIGQFLRQEKITISSEDVDAAIEKQLDAFSDNEDLRASIRGFYQKGSGFEMISSQILMEKTADRYAAILAGNAPDLDMLDAVETAVSESASEEE